jgi:hypothetical protein
MSALHRLVIATAPFLVLGLLSACESSSGPRAQQQPDIGAPDASSSEALDGDSEDSVPATPSSSPDALQPSALPLGLMLLTGGGIDGRV